MPDEEDSKKAEKQATKQATKRQGLYNRGATDVHHFIARLTFVFKWVAAQGNLLADQAFFDESTVMRLPILKLYADFFMALDVYTPGFIPPAISDAMAVVVPLAFSLKSLTTDSEALADAMAVLDQACFDASSQMVVASDSHTSVSSHVSSQPQSVFFALKLNHQGISVY
jgi:hypothetical protein